MELSRIGGQCRKVAKIDQEQEFSFLARNDSLQTLQKMTIRKFCKTEEFVKKNDPGWQYLHVQKFFQSGNF